MWGGEGVAREKKKVEGKERKKSCFTVSACAGVAGLLGEKDRCCSVTWLCAS